MANTPCEAKMNRIQGSYTAFSLALGVHAIEEIYSHYYAESPSFHAVKMWLGFWHLPAIVFAIIQILVIGGLIWYYRWLQRGKGLRVLMACLFLLLITELEHDYLRFSEHYRPAFFTGIIVQALGVLLLFQVWRRFRLGCGKESASAQ